MYNWSVDLKQLKKNEQKYTIWKLEQMVNFGLGGKKINERELEKYWSDINIDPFRRKFLKLIINDKRNLKQKSVLNSPRGRKR